MEKWELENLVMKKYEDTEGGKKDYDHITICHCPGIIGLKNIGMQYGEECNDTTCDDCWESAIKESVK